MSPHLKTTKYRVVFGISEMVWLCMSRARVVKEEIQERDTRFLALYLETKNANLALLSEGEDQLGTLAVAIPQARGMIGPPLSSILLGDRNVMVARLFAERLAEKMNKIALVSVFTKTIGEREACSILLKLVEKIVTKEESGK
ncbi:MAG: hypothetical protein AOA65_2282 [Candidatus Bathyarchaeota archaeon BA1]|nr:MAG: hypothetical protein AOA65_2282 [Candidatus Bathyarchaeota archaeon BA1]